MDAKGAIKAGKIAHANVENMEIYQIVE